MEFDYDDVIYAEEECKQTWPIEYMQVDLDNLDDEAELEQNF